MSEFGFLARCHPTGNLRAYEIEQFLSLMQTAFSVTAWLDWSLIGPVMTGRNDIEKVLTDKLTQAKSPEDGVWWDVFSSVSEGRIWVRIHTGTREFFKDSYVVDCKRIQRLPDLNYFKRCISIFHPFEAFIEDEKNEVELKAYDKQRKYPHFERPTILRWFHYMDQQLCESIGGVAHCLASPVFRVEPFCDGVLFQVTKDQFDADNPEHKESQAKAMRFLGL